MEYILAANAAMNLLNTLIPIIEQRVKSGELSAAEQQKLWDQVDALRLRVLQAMAAGGKFVGKEWELSTNQPNP